jgi:hypothetical protein
MSDSIRELPVALFTEASESMGLMSLQLPWSSTCLLHVLPDTRSYRKIPIGCQDRTAVVAEWGQRQRIVLSGTYCWSYADCRPAGGFLLHLSAFFCCWLFIETVAVS